MSASLLYGAPVHLKTCSGVISGAGNDRAQG